ncbi:MAG: GNAT family N-acetyltransferase [Candidatus Puniceispirillales bacterium]
MARTDDLSLRLGEIVPPRPHPPHPAGVTLEGRHCRLLPLSAADHGEALFAANAEDSDGSGWDYLPYGPFATLDEYRQWLEASEKGDDPTFFAVESGGRMTGVASYLRINPAQFSIEVGHIRFSPLLQSTIAATEAMYLMMAWAFDNGYRRYEWKCNALNMRSRAAAQRLGFSYEGVFRQATISKSRNRDTAWFAVIDREWPQIRGCYETWLDASNFDADGRQIKALSALTAPHLFKTDDGTLGRP